MFSDIWIAVAALPACLGLLVLASDYFLSGAVAIASRFHLPEFVVGSLIVAVGTSAPELAINIVAGLEGQGDIVISNLVGSNIVNICLGIGLAGFFTAYRTITGSYAQAFALGLFGAVALLAATLGTASGGTAFLPQAVGIGLGAVFAVYIWRSLRADHAEAETETRPETPSSLWVSLASLVGGCVAMAVFADLAVEAAVSISAHVGIPEAVIGATVIAAGGSLPEVFSCISAARRGMPDIVLGNIAGSQVFNLFGILGLTLIVTPVAYSASLAVDMALLIAATLAVFAFSRGAAAGRRAMPWALLGLYGLYGGYLVWMAV